MSQPTTNARLFDQMHKVAQKRKLKVRDQTEETTPQPNQQYQTRVVLAPIASGLRWKGVGQERQGGSVEFENGALAEALKTSCEFAVNDWKVFQVMIQDSAVLHCIRVGDQYFQPEGPGEVFSAEGAPARRKKDAKDNAAACCHSTSTAEPWSQYLANDASRLVRPAGRQCWERNAANESGQSSS